jgi:quaternary ammonium compound-resistance protein SugE
MAWIYLVFAGIFEWGWPVGLKLGVTDVATEPLWLVFAAVSMGLSGYLLLLAQRTIPMGTAYAVWTGIGAVGTFLLGILLFGDVASGARFFFIGLIIAGIIGLKMAYKDEA